MEVTIRNAVLEDWKRIQPLQAEIAKLHWQGRPDLFKDAPRYFTPETFAKRLENRDHWVLIAETAEGDVVGYAFAWVISFRNHDTYRDFDCFYIDDICVLKEYQRNGIGRRLFMRCKEIGKELHCKMLDLGVWAFNREAIGFYEACGMHDRIRKMEYNLEND